MRESLIKSIKGLKFNTSARLISIARAKMLKEAETRDFVGYQSNEYFAYCLLLEETTEDEFNEYLNSLSDKEYIELVQFPMNRLEELGKLMTAST